jgi:hypothetical protein
MRDIVKVCGVFSQSINTVLSERANTLFLKKMKRYRYICVNSNKDFCEFVQIVNFFNILSVTLNIFHVPILVHREFL